MGRLARPRRWTLLRRIVQYAALFLFVVLFVTARGTDGPSALANLPFRLDPLAALAGLLASRTVRATAAVALLTAGLTLTFGRAWCGWLCPLGTVLDLFSLGRWRGRRSPPSEAWRGAKYIVLGAIVLGALFGNLTLLVFDPLAIVFRTLGTAVWPAFDAVVTFAERGLYRIPVLRPAVGAFDAALRPGILPQQGLVARGGALFLGFFVGLIALNLLAERFWCRYLCPLGGLLGVLSKVGLIRRRVGSGCSACQLCARCCPTGTIRPEAGFASDPAECTLCLECLEACHRGDVRFPFQVGRAPRYAYDPNRRQALLTLGTAALGAGLLHADRRTRSGPSRPLRPPGASEGEMLSTCIRCGECVRACPTDALQPALVEAGLEGLWTPVMIPRLGYCSYACHACGQVCPVEAIPTLSLEVKRLAVIGRARIDRERCVAWAEALDCIVCEEMCPLPEKAVVLEHFEGRGRGAGRETVKRPHVIEARCIGCGICEYKCPVEGEAAIRVQAGHDQRPRSHPRRRGAVTSPSAPPDSQRSVLPRPHIIDTH